jgi:hypothetical protein
MKRKTSYDYYLILATAAVLFIISAICICGMFYFKVARIQELEAAAKLQYLDLMNQVMTPFVIALILLLGVCVPKRLLSTAWLNRFTAALAAAAVAVGVARGIEAALLLVLAASLVLQVIVLGMAVAGSTRLNFEKKGYLVRVGSSLLHLGLILFILDIFLYRMQALHLVLFWVTTGATVGGMIFCFYAEPLARLFGRKQQE